MRSSRLDAMVTQDLYQIVPFEISKELLDYPVCLDRRKSPVGDSFDLRKVSSRYC
jgi:hypothetical protein